MKKMIMKRRKLEKDSEWGQKSIKGPEQISVGKDEVASVDPALSAIPKFGPDLPTLDFGRPFEPEFVLPPVMGQGESQVQNVKRKPVSAQVAPTVEMDRKTRPMTFPRRESDTRRYSDWKTAFRNQKNYFAHREDKKEVGDECRERQEGSKGEAVGI